MSVKFLTESEKKLHTYLKSLLWCNYGEEQKDIGYIEIQNRDMVNIGDTVSTKRKYTLAAKPWTQNRGGLEEK